jgi:hypothetical protein
MMFSTCLYWYIMGPIRDYYYYYLIIIIIIIITLALQPAVGFGLSNNILPFLPICHQLSQSSQSFSVHHL